MSFDGQVSIAFHSAEPIAIVGVGCHLPGNISNLEELFTALLTGRDCITEIPSDRWNADSYYDSDPLIPGKTYVRHGGFVTGIDLFDASFFGISDAEASRMDPQQRMALQTVWHALENAGQSAGELAASNTGVFLAMMNTNGYAQLKAAFEGIKGVTGYDAMGDAMSIAAGRISHFLGLEGPCLAVDTACSGSMVALHLARQSILAGDCDSAIVVGVSAILTPEVHIAFSKIGLMSRSGRCRAFDESADGYVRGEGCVAVLLRRQSLAIDRGDHILAGIVGTAINQNGHTPALTAPSGRTQERVIRMALARAGINPSEIEYVEAHGTGTPVGDPIEMTALANVYGPGRSERAPLFVGSVKTNFGHIESGAGLLGVVKTALSLDRGVIFPSLHFTRLNSNIHLDGTTLCVPTAAIPWPRGRIRRMAAINSFGYSGTNAHTVMQEAPLHKDDGAPVATRPAELIFISAKSAASLQELAGNWADFLSRDEAPLFRDVAFTSALGRIHFRHRLAIVGRGKEEIREKLQSWRDGGKPRGLAAGQVASVSKPKLAFVFTGQGTQYAEMGRQLYETEPRFQAAVDCCAALMDSELGLRLRDVLFGRSSAELLNSAQFAEPALFAIQYALSDLLAYWGVEPDFVAGFSAGEIAAACACGVLDLKSAAKLVLARGRLIARLPRGGKMIQVDATPEEALASIRGKESDVALAAVIGPRHVLISGKAAAVDAVAQLAAIAGRRAKELDTLQAFHSPLMEPILGDLRAVATALCTSQPNLPMASNVTGDFLSGDIPPDYWVSHVRQPVLFFPGIRRILDAGCEAIIEIGPHPTLTQALAETLDARKTQCIPTLMRDRQDVSHVLETLASLYVIGAPLNLDHLFWRPGHRRVSVSLYPFRRDRHWIHGGEPAVTVPPNKNEIHPLLGKLLTAGPNRAVFEAGVSANSPWVDHRVLGSTVFPGAAYLEMAARGFAAAAGHDWLPVVMRDVTFERPLLLTYGATKRVSITLEMLPQGRTREAEFVIASLADGGTDICCRGRIARAGQDIEVFPIENAQGRMSSQLRIGQFYGDLRKKGLEYGADFSNVRELWLGDPDSGEALGHIIATASDTGEDPHPFQSAVLLDTCMQVFDAGLRTFIPAGYPGAFVPVSIQAVTLRRPLPVQCWSLVAVRVNRDGRAASARIQIMSHSGEVLAKMDGLELRQKSELAGSAGEPVARADGASHNINGAPESRGQLVARLRGSPHEKRIAALATWLVAEIRDVLGQAAEEIDFDSIDPSCALLEIGLDSLAVTELQRRIQEKLEFRFQPMQGLDYQSIESLAEYLLNDVLKIDKPAQIVSKTAAAQPGSRGFNGH